MVNFIHNYNPATSFTSVLQLYLAHSFRKKTAVFGNYSQQLTTQTTKWLQHDKNVSTDKTISEHRRNITKKRSHYTVLCTYQQCYTIST